MNVRKLETRDIPAICQAACARLLTTTEASFQLDGISDKWGLLYPFMHTRLAHWQRAGEVWIVGDNDGLLAGHYRKNERVFSSLRLVLAVMRHVWRPLSKADRAQLVKNLKQASGTEDTAWRKRLCGRQSYYYIDLVVITEAKKGSGAFRQLLEPVLIRMAREGIPVLLDTHDPNNVAIYKHFGFQLVRTHEAKENRKLAQYSMVKWPCGENPEDFA